MAARRSRWRNGTNGAESSRGTTGAGRWMVSYSDFMTLLFVVFMVLFSSASIDKAKYAAIAEAFQQYVGLAGTSGGLAPLPTGGSSGEGQPTPVLPGEGGGTEPAEPDWVSRLVEPGGSEEEGSSGTEAPQEESASPVETSPSQGQTSTGSAETSGGSSDSMSGVAEAFQVLPGARSGILSVALQERGVVISIAGSVLFAPGEVTLKPDAQSYLDQVAQELRDVELPIMVEGTADREGSSSAGTYSPWDLAALRAGAVVNYFVQHHGIPGSRFVTIGYGSANTAQRPPDMVTIVVLRKAE